MGASSDAACDAGHPEALASSAEFSLQVGREPDIVARREPPCELYVPIRELGAPAKYLLS
ncbi:hypothetical protein ES706_00999 [subsurface metagenome]